MFPGVQGQTNMPSEKYWQNTDEGGGWRKNCDATRIIGTNIYLFFIEIYKIVYPYDLQNSLFTSLWGPQAPRILAHHSSSTVRTSSSTSSEVVPLTAGWKLGWYTSFQEECTFPFSHLSNIYLCWPSSWATDWSKKSDFRDTIFW